MSEVYKEIRKAEYIEKGNFTGLQAVAFAMKSYEHLNKDPKVIKYHKDLFGGYMLTLMTMHKPSSVEPIAMEVFEKYKKKEIGNNSNN